MLNHQQYCDAIVVQCDLLRAQVTGSPGTVDVPSCPGWNLGQLLRHLGGVYYWQGELIETRSQQPLSDAQARQLSQYTAEDITAVDPWLATGARYLSDALRDAVPTRWSGLPCPTPAPRPSMPAV